MWEAAQYAKASRLGKLLFLFMVAVGPDRSLGPAPLMLIPKGPSRVSRSKNHSEYGFGDLKPYYLGTRTLWVSQLQ